MASLSQGAACSFGSVSFEAISVRVESAAAELADMTPIGGNAGTMRMIPTGGVTSPGSITIEALSPSYPSGLLKKRDTLVFGGTGVGVSINAICTSVSVEAKVGDLIRSTITFVPTDYYG